MALAGLPPRAAVTAQVADALGRAVGPRYFGNISSDGATALRLPITGLGTGLYVVRIQIGSTSFSKKLVIQ